MVLFGVVVFIPLIVTLYNLMIRDHDYYEAQAIDNQTRYTSLSASRGQIFDRNMNVLASSKTVETVFIDPNEIAQEMTKPENSNLLDHIARGLSEILDVETLCLELIKVLLQDYSSLLEARYKVEEISEDGLEAMEQIAHKRGFIFPGKRIDYERTAKTVLDEFRGGKIGRITLERCENAGREETEEI